MGTLFQSPTTPRLSAILAEVRSGQLLIPDFQRPFVWTDAQRVDLLDSVAQGLPIGAFMLWVTHRHRLDTRRKIGPFELPQPSESGPWTYLIDGHQRLTTLFAALEHHDSEFEMDDLAWPMQVVLSDPPMFRVRRKRGEPEGVRTADLMSGKSVYRLQQALWSDGNEGEADRLEELRNRFIDYQIPLIPLVSEDVDLVVAAFARVNTGGTQMSEAHLAAALAYNTLPMWEELEGVQQWLEERGWVGIGDGAILNGLKLRHGIDVYRAPIKELIDHYEGDAAAFRDDIRRTKLGLEMVFEVMADSGVLGPHSVPYTYQILLLAEAMLGVEWSSPWATDKRAMRWFWQTTWTEAFTGATGSRFAKALQGLTAYLEGGDAPYDGEEVVLRSTASRWGSVSTTARMWVLADAAESDEQLRLLGRQGTRVVHKLLPELDGRDRASWVVATPETLSSARLALQNDDACPEELREMIEPEAWQALVQGDVGRFSTVQGEFIDGLEIRSIEHAGLRVSPVKA